MIKYKNKFILIFVLLFIFALTANAQSGYTTDKTGLSLRDAPSTKNSKVILTIPYNEEFYISNTEAGTGGGCSNNWYYVYYKGNYGYVCSSLVGIVGELKTSYERPWTTPKKAIVGGAEYISNGYIAKGQYTSYLKKFNVNPEGYYSLHNHQYMANLRAPASEAASTYKSLNENNFLSYAFEFTIPVFNDMPESTYNANIYDTGRKEAGVQDEAFETSIKDFPESYKPYLRYLHTIHSNWIFKPMKTNTTFDESYLAEKPVCSIEISSGQCDQNNYTVTESGWCIANEASTKLFLDPRNFLSEKYIFMFENLSFSERYNEEIVQSVLNGTFMSDISVLDNQSYKSIFVEAGKIANVSPLYLASLARQESGTKVSKTTSGAEFTYEGYTYSGLYNFFNIGASSGEENPALAGLVWANGGKGVNASTAQPSTDNVGDTASSNNFLSLLQLSKTSNYVKGYGIGTTIGRMKEIAGASVTIVVKDKNGKVLSDTDVLGTGYTIDITDGTNQSTFKYVMYGDLNGDGEVNSADLLSMRQHLLGTNSLKNEFLESAYVNKKNEVNSSNLLKLRQYLLGTSNIIQ